MPWTRLLISALIFALTLPAAAEDFLTITPAEDTNAVLHNPDMGWVIYENFPLDQDARGSSTLIQLPGDDLPEADAAALMFTWQDVESSPGRYDFSKVDPAYEYWRQRGQTIQLRLSAASLIFWAHRNPPAGMGTPDYVLARMPARQKQTRKMGRDSYVVVDARNAYYRKRLGAFLRAVEQHFDAQQPVNLIDLRGFGAWGEWHSGFRYDNVEDRRAGLKAILDVWSESLPHHQLALSYSYDPDGPKELYAGPAEKLDPAFTTNYEAYLNYSAFDYALTKTNITFRRDGCGGAVHSNERQLSEQAFSTLRRAPMMGEFLSSYSAMKKGADTWVAWAVDDALSLHPNYLNLIGWQANDARNFARQRPDLIARGLRQMGYRLVPTRVQRPAQATNGVPFEIRFDWINRGVGRALRDYQIRFLIVTPDGAVVADDAPDILPTSQWLAGSSYSSRNKGIFQNIPPGDYQLAFVLRDPATQRAIALPLRNGGPEGSYKLGPVRILPPR